MARKMSADDIIEAIGNLEESTRSAFVKEIICDLREFHQAGMTDGDTDTWKSGFAAAIEVITSNYR